MLKKCARFIILTMLLSLFTLNCCGCGNESQSSETDVAKKLLNTMINISDEDLTLLDEAKSEDAMIEWMSRYEEYMTEDGIQSGMLNRVLTRGALLRKDGIDTSDAVITVEERKQSEKGWYNYEIKVSDDDIISGSMHLADGKCDKITVN